jgi:perosamine synthetase
MIPYGKHYIDEDDIQAVTNVLRNGFLTQGPKVVEFEQAIADYTGAKYAVAVSHGTAALHLAAIVAGVGADNALVTSPITFVASANAGLYVGAEVLFADIDNDTINMSPEALKLVVKTHKNVRAIVPVHFAGLPCDMMKIKQIADEIGAVVIEDAAHALGSSYPDGTKVGCCSQSLMTAFSFHPVKSIAAGEGGMITTNDEDAYHQLLRLRSHGINKTTDKLFYPDQTDEKGIHAQWYYEMQELGYNYRITDIQSALALSQLAKLDKFIQRRKEIVRKYDQAFVNTINLRSAQMVEKDKSGHHIYVLRINFRKAGISRQSFIESLKGREIGSQVHYIPVPMQPKYKQLGANVNEFPNAIKYYNQALSIPLFYSLQNKEQEHIINIIKDLLK